MARLTSDVFFDEFDEVEADVLDVNGSEGQRQVVMVSVGGVKLYFRAKDLDLLKSLETCTAEARRDLEAIVAGLKPFTENGTTEASAA